MRQHVDPKLFVSSSVLCGLLVVSSWSSRGLPGSAGGPESSSLVVSSWFPGSFPVVFWSPGAVRSLFLSDLPLLKHFVREAEAFPSVQRWTLDFAKGIARTSKCIPALFGMFFCMQEPLPPCFSSVFSGVKACHVTAEQTWAGDASGYTSS